MTAVEAMTARQLHYWYDRAVAYYEARGGASQTQLEEQRQLRGL